MKLLSTYLWFINVSFYSLLSFGDTTVFEYRSEPIKWARERIRHAEEIKGGFFLTNLYAKGGVLEKFDRVFGSTALEWEIANNRIAYDRYSEKWWWGHCDGLSQASVIFFEPEHAVMYKDVLFSVDDIKALLVFAADSFSENITIKGTRGDSSYDDGLALSPLGFYRALKDELTMDVKKPPIVINVGKRFPNYSLISRPFDKVTIIRLDIEEKPTGPFNFKIVIESSKYSDFNQEIDFFADASDLENAKVSEWGSKGGPDIVWWFHKKQDNNDLWRGQSKRNPKINLAHIKLLYDESRK